MDAIYKKIDRAIKEAWRDGVIKDYNNDAVLMEDTLKNIFYYHLRLKLSDGFCKRNLIRIFTEYSLNSKKRKVADLVVARLKPKSEVNNDDYLKNRVIEVLALIEFKYKAGNSVKQFLKDIDKIRYFIKLKRYQNCQFYFASIQENCCTFDGNSWLTKRQQDSWAKGRFTEMSGFYDEDYNFTNVILSYNGLNNELNSI